MLPSLIGITGATPKQPKNIAFANYQFHQKAFHLTFLPMHQQLVGYYSIAATPFFKTKLQATFFGFLFL